MADGEGSQRQTWFAAHFTVWARICFGLGGLGVLVAGVLLSATSWMTQNPWWTERAPVFAVAAMAGCFFFVTLGGFNLMQQAPRQNRSEYAPFIFGLGILMAGVGGTGVVGVAGLIHSRNLDRPAVSETTNDEEAAIDTAKLRENETALRESEERRARFVLLAGAMAFIGSLFYIALALWRKQHHGAHCEPFDVGKLVSGAALRSGEAMLFTLVFVLLTQVGGSTDFDGWLPVMGLMLGMFVKSGERLVFNLATRIFDLAESIVPSSNGKKGENAIDELDEHDHVHEETDERRDERVTTASGANGAEETPAPEGTNGSGKHIAEAEEEEPRPAVTPS